MTSQVLIPQTSASALEAWFGLLRGHATARRSRGGFRLGSSRCSPRCSGGFRGRNRGARSDVEKYAARGTANYGVPAALLEGSEEKLSINTLEFLDEAEARGTVDEAVLDA